MTPIVEDRPFLLRDKVLAFVNGMAHAAAGL